MLLSISVDFLSVRWRMLAARCANLHMRTSKNLPVHLAVTISRNNRETNDEEWNINAMAQGGATLTDTYGRSYQVRDKMFLY